MQLAKRASWMLLGNGVFAACQALNLIILARLDGAYSAGVFTFALSVCAPILLFTNLGMRAQVMTDVSHAIDPKDYLFVRRGFALLGLLLCMISGFFLCEDVNSLAIVVFVAVSKAVESQADLLYGVLQREGRHRVIAISLIAKGVFGLIGLSVGLYVSSNVVVAVALYTAFWIVSYLVIDFRSAYAIFLSSKPDLPLEKKEARWLVLKNGLPLGLASLCIAGSASIPRLALSEVHGLSLLGVFATLAAVVQVGTLVVSSIGQAVSPRLAKAFSEKDSAGFIALAIKAAAVCMLVGLLGAIVAKFLGVFIVSLILGRGSPDYAELLFWMFISAMPQYLATFLGHVMTSTRRNTRLFSVQIVSVFSTVVLAYSLVPAYGALGAAVTTGVSAFLATMLYVVNIVGAVKKQAAC